MSIFIHKDSRVVVQGVTGKEGAFWAKHMKDMGTQVVFGVTPGKEGQDVDGIPVYRLFSPDDIAGYISSSPKECPMCRAGQKIDALANSFGLSML